VAGKSSGGERTGSDRWQVSWRETKHTRERGSKSPNLPIVPSLLAPWRRLVALFLAPSLLLASPNFKQDIVISVQPVICFFYNSTAHSKCRLKEREGVGAKSTKKTSRALQFTLRNTTMQPHGTDFRHAFWCRWGPPLCRNKSEFQKNLFAGRVMLSFKQQPAYARQQHACLTKP
jgi:hypothetical protein